MNDVWIGIIPYKYLKCYYGIGMKTEYDMKHENELKSEHEHEKKNVMNIECD